MSEEKLRNDNGFLFFLIDRTSLYKIKYIGHKEGGRKISKYSSLTTHAFILLLLYIYVYIMCVMYRIIEYIKYNVGLLLFEKRLMFHRRLEIISHHFPSFYWHTNDDHDLKVNLKRSLWNSWNSIFPKEQQKLYKRSLLLSLSCLLFSSIFYCYYYSQFSLICIVFSCGISSFG